jgi:glutaredoxin
VFTKSRQLTNQRSFSSTNAIMPPIDDQLKNQVIKWISDTSSPVVIFSKTTCPYCKKVKELFESLSIKTNVVELDQLPNGSQIQEGLLVITGQKTVPNVFVRGRHVGGCDATVKLHEHGKLVAMARGEPSGPSQAPQVRRLIN